MANSDSNNSMIIAIVAILAVFVVVYLGLMFFNNQAPGTAGGTTAGIDVNLGTNGGGSTTPPPYAQ